MGDVIFVVVIVAFFAAAATYVRACESIVGADELPAGADDQVDHLEAAA